MKDDDRLEAQVAARAAAKSAYPPAAIDTPFPPEAPQTVLPPPGMSPEELDADAEYDKENCTHQDEDPLAHPLFRKTDAGESYIFQVFRLTTGEWVMSQVYIAKDEAGPRLVFYKPYSFNLAPNQQGQVRLQVAPWPVVSGTIELDQVFIYGDFQDPEAPLDLMAAYVKLISNVQIAGEKDVRRAAQTQRQVKKILDARGN